MQFRGLSGGFQQNLYRGSAQQFNFLLVFCASTTFSLAHRTWQTPLHDLRHCATCLSRISLFFHIYHFIDYVTRLEHFDGEEVALVLERRGLYEEAFVVLDNFNCYGEAGRVLVERVGDLERGRRYAEKCDERDVWELVGRSLLNKGELNAVVVPATARTHAHIVQNMVGCASRVRLH